MIAGIPARAQPGASTSLCPSRSCPRPLRRVAARNKDEKSKGSEQGKADFSAYWSLKIKEAMDNRRKYLEEIDRRGIPESEVVQKVEAKAEEVAKQLSDLIREEKELKKVKLQARLQLEEQAARDAERIFKTSDTPVPMPREDADALVIEDVERARADLRSAAVSGFALNMYRARELIRTVLLLPFTLAATLRREWVALYSSQRYENFLMSEGERIWYWRNRTENERWFWEIAFWDRFAMPILCTFAYEYLVPNNFLWAVVVPLTFIFIQSGELPSWRGVEFWLIAYFGFYVKCWPDVLALLKGLFFLG